MNLVIFGDSQHWKRALDLLTTYRPDIKLVGLSSPDIDKYRDSDVTLSLREVKALYDNHIIDGVIQIQGENPYYFQSLEQLDISDIYVIPHTLYCKAALDENLSHDSIIYHYHDVLPELMQLEFHLADHCNLNCKGCSHFSNLVPCPTFADKEQFSKDIKQLATYFSQIHNFYLLGGEPFLNQELGDYIPLIHEAFPYAKIIIVTNGILLLTLQDSLIHTIKEHQVHISISDYSCLDREKIISFVQKHMLSADLREGKECFSKYLNPKGDSDKTEVFFQCIRRNCTFLDKGRIAACCQPFTIHYFNSYFNEHLPENEGIDLYEKNLNGWEIQKRLTTPMESCRYCSHDVPFDWEMSHAPFSKDDWCI